MKSASMSIPAIEVKNLIKVYEKRRSSPVRALDGISFSVRQGEIFGLLGPNGAGKSTALKILTTLLQPTSGIAEVLGHNVITEPLEVRKNICVVVQEDAVELYLTVKNNFVAFGQFHGLSRKEIDQRAGRVIELFGLREFLNQQPIDLSGGVRRRVQVAKMFLVDKPVVFLDEATTGMDTISKRATLNAIKEESREGRTIVLTTHMLEEAEELCTSLAILNHGSIITQGSLDVVKAATMWPYYLWMTFGKLTRAVRDALRRIPAVKTEIKDRTVELTLKDQQTALKAVARMQKTGLLHHFEITGASLEDVFVELLDKHPGGSP
jgi:ABC-2 type transport system ATP-binding protein